MKTALLIHGTPDREEYYGDDYPALSNSHWFAWLQKKLLQNDYLTQTPEMPAPVTPSYNSWKEMLECFPLNEETILIGHSCGGGFLLRYLSEHKIHVKRTILGAPWLDPFKEKDPEFFDFRIDPELIFRTDLHMFYSNNDMETICLSVNQIREAVPNIKTRLFKNYGHFCYQDMGTDAYPELLNTALGK